MEYTLNDIEYMASVCHADKITLHWGANHYEDTSDHYHINILGDGTIYSDYDNLDVYCEHTWHRNTNNIGISLSCCFDAGVWADGTVKFGTEPPTDKQVDTMAKIVYKICKAKGWDIVYDRVKTHAEWADIDGYGIHDSDPDMRWDLLKLPQEDGEGGDIIRGKAIYFQYHPELCEA